MHSFQRASLSIFALVAACAPAPATQAPATPAAAPSTSGAPAAAEPVTSASGAAASAAPASAPPAQSAGTLAIDLFTAPDDTGAVNSYLIEGDKELIVVDGQLVVPAAEALVKKIKDKKKAPKAFVLTHAHPDHYFGFFVLQQAFPGVPLYAAPGVKADFDASAKGTLDAMKGMLGGAAPTGVATVTALDKPLELAGAKIELVEVKGGEHAVSSVLRVPSLHAVLAGDTLYHRVHNWMKECDAKTWIAQLEEWKKGDPATVYFPGHGAGKGGVELLDANIAYIQGFQAEVAQAKGKDDAARVADAKKRVLAKFPAYKAPQFLDWTMGDYMKCSRPAAASKAPATQPAGKDAKKPAAK
jgi:glyoxylase-like metal-dependent hydrolase (beta-lactamase superfamily II)